MNKKILFLMIIFALFILLLLGVKSFYANDTAKNISDFESCQNAGYPILDSYPEQCQLPSGKTFTKKIDDQIACTMDAKICPDGSYVGRIAPNCDFAPCPNEPN